MVRVFHIVSLGKGTLLENSRSIVRVLFKVGKEAPGLVPINGNPDGD